MLGVRWNSVCQELDQSAARHYRQVRLTSKALITQVNRAFYRAYVQLTNLGLNAALGFPRTIGLRHYPLFKILIHILVSDSCFRDYCVFSTIEDGATGDSSELPFGEREHAIVGKMSCLIGRNHL